MKKLLVLLICFLISLSLMAESISLNDEDELSRSIANQGQNIEKEIESLPENSIGSIKSLEQYGCPTKKVPVIPGNFEVIEGNSVFPPIDTQKLETVVIKSLLSRGYKILNVSPGVITYQLWKRDYDLTMRFCYCQDEYWYEYVNSRNLNANPMKNKIHKSYYRWISIIEKDISKQLY